MLLNWSHPRSVPVGDADLSVHLGGRGTPVLILPGFPASPRTFLPLAEALAQEYLVILPYLAGTGPSRRPLTGGYSIQQSAQRIWNLCETLGARHLHVIGQGLGGAIAYWLALHRQQQIERMVILSTPLRGFPARAFLSALRLGCPGVADALLLAAGPAVVQRLYREWTGPGFTVPAEELERAVATWAPRGRRRIAAAYYGAPRNLLAYRTFRDAWIKVPTLLIFGSKASGVSRHSIDSTVEAIDKVRVKILAGVGHVPQLESAAKVTDLVTAFLGRQQKERPGTESMGRPLG